MTDATAARIRDWLTRAALPLWSSVGVDAECGGFVESLSLSATPNLAEPKRVRVQARQIYVFSHAAFLGLWPDGVAVARRGFDFLKAHAGLGSGKCVPHLLGREGEIIDAKRDTYDQAFVLLALSWLYRASREAIVRDALDAEAAAIERELRHPVEGYLEDDRGSLPRRQNPHMHLFEAFLAAFEATQNPLYLERASDIFALFRRRLFDSGAGILREFFADNLRPAPGDLGDIVEPGHHFEWVWLLDRYATLAKIDCPAEVRRLHDVAVRFGIEAGSGLVFDEISADGTTRKRSKRCWPQTEALKAELTLGGPSARAAQIAANIFEHYLDAAPLGAWNDSVGRTNQPVSTAIPASTFYHVFSAFTENLKASA